MTTPVEQFLYAEQQLDEVRARWNALPSPEARLASGLDLNMYAQVAARAARELIADAAERHRIEESAKVYLRLGPEGWVVDNPTGDGYGLDGYEDGPLNEACGDDEGEHDEQECEALVAAASHLDLPNAEELLALLTEYLEA